MGCAASSKPAAPSAPPPAPPAAPTLVPAPAVHEEKKHEEPPKAPKPPIGNVEIYGVAGSMNCMGPMMLIMDVNCGKLVPTMPYADTRKPEFLAMNPFHAVPVLKDAGYLLAETSAILRYLAEKYAHNLQPASPLRAGFIEWAMERVTSTLYADCYNGIYPALGYTAAPADVVKGGADCTRNLQEFADFFLREKFIGGEHLSIADYKVAPFLFCYAHPFLKEKYHIQCPERVMQFNHDFAAACPAAATLSSAGGQSLRELLDAKYGSSPPLLTMTKVIHVQPDDIFKHKRAHGHGKVEIYGLAGSMNACGPIMLTTHMGIGKMVHTMPGEATKTHEFLAMNPFHAVPTMKDGDYSLAESNAILRYLAVNYAPDYYPVARRGFIDWAMDRFTTGMYADVPPTIYACLGYVPMPEDEEVRKAAGKQASENLKSFADFFMKEKFLGGPGPSIADFKVYPFFFAYAHPLLKEKFFIDLPARISKFNEDFAKAIKDSTLLREAGGFSIKEMMDKKVTPPAHTTAQEKATEEQLKAAMQTEASHSVRKQEIVMDEPPTPVCGCFH